MNIAIFHELQPGGARRMVNALATLLKKKYTVDLYLVDSKNNREEDKFFTSKYFYKFTQKKWLGKNWPVRLYKDTVELFKLYNLHKEISSTINAKKYDVLFIHPSQYTQAPFILRFLHGKKIYYCPEVLRIVYEKELIDGTNASFLKGLYERVNRMVRKNLDFKNITSADLVLTNSKFSRNNIRKAYAINSQIIYPGVDTLQFKPAKITKDIDVLYIGAKEKVENYTLLQEAVELIPEKIKVVYHFTDNKWIPDERLRRLYQKAKIVVCLHKNEPFGMIPLEAGSCGVPVIALDSGGYKESIRNNKTGYLIPADKEILANKIKIILSNRKKQIEMGNQARKEVLKNWQWAGRIPDLEKSFKMTSSK